MTTNVYDYGAGVFASDSRWSKIIGDWIVYIDDTGYDKIVFDDTLAMLFAGDMPPIEKWKQWFLNGRISTPPVAHLKGISICIAEMKTGKFVFDSGHSLRSGDSRFAGTGAPHAMNCWDMNKDARKAVETATTLDVCSGGKVVYLERISLGTNVANCESHDRVYEQLKERGMMKNLKETRQPVLLKDAVNDPVANGIAKQFMSGQNTLCAPFPGMHEDWTEEKKQELINVLSQYQPAK